jgi:hypothetical protein
MALQACMGNHLPDGVLPKKMMVPILVDIHLSEAIYNQRFSIALTRDSLPEDLYLSICKKYKIERSVVEKSLLYYGKHTEAYIPIYEQVLDKLSELEVKVKSDTLRPASVGGFELDSSKVKKSVPPSEKK